MALRQPIDQAVFTNIKKVNRQQMLSKLVESKREYGVVEIKSVNVKTMIYMMTKSWNQITMSPSKENPGKNYGHQHMITQ